MQMITKNIWWGESPPGDLPDCQVRSLSEQPVLRYCVNGPVAGTKKGKKKKNKKSKNNRSAFACRSKFTCRSN